MLTTSAASLRLEVWKIIAADLTASETRAAVMNLIPNEFHSHSAESGRQLA